MATETPIIFKQWPDGYMVRSMTREDAKTVQRWYNDMTPTSKFDLDIMLDVYPRDRGFYIGEIGGEVVCSAIRLPVCDGIYYGSYYYTDKKHRRKGYGKKLRDEVAAGHVGDNILCIDAHDDLVEMDKRVGYVPSFAVTRYSGVASCPAKLSDAQIVKTSAVPLGDIIAYDNQCFVRPGSNLRKAFLEKWLNIAGGSAYAALDRVSNKVVGMACRRPTFQAGYHLIGPVYGDDEHIAQDLVSAICADITGENIAIDICGPNNGARTLVRNLVLKDELHMVRMHLNGDPKEFNPKVFGLTSIDVCGF